MAAFQFVSGLHAQETAAYAARTKSKAPPLTFVYAAWYNVPPDSLARRRAKLTGLTAAHNRLPLGTFVRVTRVSNGKNVVVCITDRGITNRRAKIDICREAAEQLGMLQEGIARVHLEIVPESTLIAVPDPNRVAAP